MRLAPFISLLLCLLGTAYAQKPQGPAPAEDPRITFVKGLLLQVYSKATADWKATDDELYATYKNRFVQTQDQIETDEDYKARVGRYQKLVKDIAAFARGGIDSTKLFEKIRLGANDETSLGSDVVAWEIKLPDNVIVTDLPGKRPRVVILLIYLVDQHQIENELVERGKEDWKIRMIVLAENRK